MQNLDLTATSCRHRLPKDSMLLSTKANAGTACRKIVTLPEPQSLIQKPETHQWQRLPAIEAIIVLVATLESEMLTKIAMARDEASHACRLPGSRVVKFISKTSEQCMKAGESCRLRLKLLVQNPFGVQNQRFFETGKPP